MADQLGPRVRLFAVTADMPLQPDRPIDRGVEAFCRACKKCATACPSRSIPLPEPKTEILRFAQDESRRRAQKNDLSG